MPDPLPVATTLDQQDLLTRLSALLASRTGLALMPNQWRDLQRAVTATAAELELPDFLACAECLLTTLSPRPLQILIDHLTIGETYFFRDAAIYAALREYLLPPLVTERRDSERRLRIWCAGCSTGEEAYSIAIELSRALPDLANWDATVLATDINQRFLRKAANGIYDRWSFRDSPPEEREPYIHANAEGRFVVVPTIKKLVRFAHLNLTEKIYPSPINGTSDIDIIFCRNVLMYLQPDSAQAVLQQLCNALRPNGWLIVSNVETSLVNLPNMLSIRLPNVMLFRKEKPDIQPNKKSTVRSAHAAANSDDNDMRHSEPERAATKRKQQISKTMPLVPPLPSMQGDASKQLLLNAKIDADQGHFATALQYCEQALAIDKLNPVTHYLLASILLEWHTTHNEQKIALAQEMATTQTSEVNSAAENALKRALYLDSEWVMPHIALGNLLHSQPLRQAEAKRHFDNARALLNRISLQQVVPETEGLTAGQLLEMINVMSTAEMTP